MNDSRSKGELGGGEAPASSFSFPLQRLEVMNDSSSSYNSSFYNQPYFVFTPEQTYNETAPTVSSQNDRNLNNDFPPSYHLSFEQNTELDGVGLGTYGSTFHQYQVPQPQAYQPASSYGIEAAYGDVSNWPLSDVRADPWTPTPSSNGYNHGAAAYQTARTTTTGMLCLPDSCRTI